MKNRIAASLAVSLALVATSASAQTRTERGEQRLAELIEGRVAGEPETCIGYLRPNGMRIIENVGLVYEQGSTIWVARVQNPRRLTRDDVPIFQRVTSQLCTNDIIRTVDRYNGFFTGVLNLEQFVPYTRPENG